MNRGFAKLNQLQMPTWRWLNINDVSLETGDIPGGYAKEPVITGAEEIAVRREFTVETVPGLPGDLQQNLLYARENAGSALQLVIPAGKILSAPVVIDYCLDDDNRALVDALHIRAEAGSRATVVVRYASQSDAPCFHCGFTFLEVEPAAELKLIKVQLLAGRDIHLDAVAAEVREQAHVNVLLGELGSLHTVAGCNIRLAGQGSYAELDAMYSGTGIKTQDFNYRIEFAGKESEGHINAKGALAGQARKILRSTIDFITGGAGARGREEETVLALSDRVVNLSAPLLLCGEDDVQGEHATSTGKPDVAKLYYLMSRGFSEKEARRLLIEASFTPLLNKIEPETLKEEILAHIQEVVHGE